MRHIVPIVMGIISVRLGIQALLWQTITNRILHIKRESISPLNYFTGIGLQISKTHLI